MEELRNEKRTMEHRPHSPDKQLPARSQPIGNQQTEQLNANVAQSELLKGKQMGEPINCTNSELDIYLQELEAGYLPTSCSGINRSLLSKSKTIREKYWSKDKRMESCHSFQPLETSKTSTEIPGEDQLTFFAEDSLAKTSVRRVKEQELPESVRDFGKSMRDSLARCGLDLSLPKTHHCFALGDLELSSKIWPRWGIMLDGECSELGMLVHGTKEKDFGSWLPTICKSESKGSGRSRFIGSSEFRGAKMSEGLRTCKEDPIYLTPLFGEIAMGFPPMWTELQPLETHKHLNAQHWHSIFSQKD